VHRLVNQPTHNKSLTDPQSQDSVSQTSSDDTLVRIRQLSYGYGERKIFDQLSMDIPRCGITAIMGPSGTGKTTLLKLISGQLYPQSGTIEVDGLDVQKLSRSRLFELRKRIGMLFQSGALLTDITVFENVAYPLREHTRLNESMIRRLVLLKLNAVGLRGAADLMPSQLSGGMARRVALARAIALDPMMIMYDEPFTGQDPISLGVLIELISELNDALDICSIVVSHDVRETMSIADQVHIISDGKVVESGSPESLDRSERAWTRQFIHGEADGPVPFHYPARPIRDDLFS
jgi:phospholipid/cholesterol/gamma-HCH transport system ATP-binding protein